LSSHERRIAYASAASSRRRSASAFSSIHPRNAASQIAPYLTHLGQSRRELAFRQGRERRGIRDHGKRLMECPDHVLAQGMVDGGLAANRRVDLREERRRDLQVCTPRW
jgi:hypothetical protein